MSRFWSDINRVISPYIPGEQPKNEKYIKLNTNENPYPPSPQVVKAIEKVLNDSLRLYPDPTCEDLRLAIAEYYDLKKEQVHVGNGSDELLAFSFLAFFNPNGLPILMPDITYSFYKVYTSLFKINCEKIPLEDDFSIRPELFYKKNGGVVIANPNAPTGMFLPLEDITGILEHNPDQVVIVDEAYIDFGGISAVKLIGDYPNLLVIKTLSKSRSLAGLRVGYALGQKELIEGIDRIKNSINSYTLDRLALAGANAAIKDDAYFQEVRRRIIMTRERVSNTMGEIGFKVLPSKANFIFVTHPLIPAGELFQKLRENGVLVRYFKEPRIDNFLRVSIGSDQEMDSFISILKSILHQML
ncbi:histidinol-phosphate transaminase [Pelotomaculum propionicicum]|uniref:Histidinol-phosphate aminotransferase n=1 Tax=Pelotomaculum propionicicum TaxID=258475 RepID=A0A4Y7RLW6_9FIRM|nr:histidinol-phosphate transaminase [Pelotomaculum propionicicum]TEB09863.1 Histidinol-phosphate aminotransferase [Pelotomaculum propionicicum]